MRGAKHTPGPWGVVREDDEGGAINFLIEGANGHIHLCGLYGGRDADDKAAGAGDIKADAALIAAAPDLLAACEKVKAAVEMGKHTPGFPLSVLCARDLAFKAVVDAIAKARQ